MILSIVGRLKIPNKLKCQNYLYSWKALFNWFVFCSLLRVRPKNPVGPHDAREQESRLDLLLFVTWQKFTAY